MRADVGWFGVEGGWGGAWVVWFARGWRVGWWCGLGVEVAAEVGYSVDSLGVEFFEAVEGSLDSMHF